MQAIEQRHQQSADAQPGAGSDRELLTWLVGADIAGKLSDDECARLNSRITQLIQTVRQRDFNDGYDAGIDHCTDYAQAFFSTEKTSH